MANTTAPQRSSELRKVVAGVWLAATGLILLLLARPAIAGSDHESKSKDHFNAGVGVVDITPTDAVVLAGSPTARRTSTIGTRLFARALVISVGDQKVAIVTLDTLKYPVDLATEARKRIEQSTGIPMGNVMICSSHTHSGPLWSYYTDKLITPINQAVALAVRDLAPCEIGTAKGSVDGVSENRRVLIDGQAWNRWQVKPSEREKYPAEGPFDPGVEVLAVTGKDGRYKAIVFNYACHAADNRALVISADYPGDVQKYVAGKLGYDVPALFLTGACGDVNPVYSAPPGTFGEKLGAEVVRCLEHAELIAKPALWVESKEVQIPGRENPQFNEKDVSLKWSGQFQHYQAAYDAMKKREKRAYPCFFTGIRIGDNFAIVTCPVELFCAIGLSIKHQSSFQHTIVAEQTNGAHGYVPTAKSFEGGGYETWFGEHSYLTVHAGQIIENESVEILKDLKKAH